MAIQKIRNDRDIKVRATTLGSRRGRSVDAFKNMPPFDVGILNTLLQERFKGLNDSAGAAAFDATEIEAATAAAQSDADANAQAIATLQSQLAATQTQLTAAQNTIAGLSGGSTSIEVQLTLFDYTTSLTTGNGKGYFYITSKVAGKNLVYVHARVITAGSAGGLTTFNVVRLRPSPVNMLSTPLTLDHSELGTHTAAAPFVINQAVDDVAEGDLLRIDISYIATTAPKGLIFTLRFA